tara:strand:- start:16 stop:951 length:936 start_codon:yes stop_codon:yes gene_type:complete
MIVIVLKGGLGNQLFQLCLYLELLNHYKDKNVYLDNKTGFFLDLKYKRCFQLKKAISASKFNSRINSFFNIVIIIFKRYSNFYFLHLFKIKIIQDSEFKFKGYKKNYDKGYLLFNGYFQNYQLVKKNFSKLIEYIQPYLLKKVDRKFQNLYDKILAEKNSVALCIRLYEEVRNPNDLPTSNKSEKEFFRKNNLSNSKIIIRKYNKVIKEIEKKVKNPHFFIFVQKNNKVIENLKFNSKSTLITIENGYSGDWENIRAISYCKHHIFNNSTFYFWGTVFSLNSEIYKNAEQLIYASSNFIFKEIYAPNWIIF